MALANYSNMEAYFVLKVDRSVEVGDLRVDRLADHFTLASVHETTHLYNEKHVRIYTRDQAFDYIYLALALGDREAAGNLRAL